MTLRFWRHPRRLFWTIAALVGYSGAATAHTLVTPYDLPIPFSVYVYACAATLLLTFAVLSLTAEEAVTAEHRPAPSVILAKSLPMIGQCCAVALLTLTIVAGFFGTASPIANVAPTLFWVGLMLGLTTLTALFGDCFQIVNPWRTVARILRIGQRPRLPYPPRLASWPAFASYLALTWIELMAPPRPSLLAAALVTYTALTLVGSALFGRDVWFNNAELFDVFFRVVGTIAPVVYEREGGSGQVRWRATWRAPLSGVLDATPRDLSMLLFVLFMLAGTTYDGVWQTSFWAGLYWGNLMRWLQPLWGDDMARAQALLAPGYVIYQHGGLILAPFVYLGVYGMVIAAMRALTGGAMTLGSLALRFAFTLVPIALAYMLAHSWTFILMVIPVVPFLLSDPFGIGWNLLALPRLSAEPDPLNMGQVWHFEVALILLGHVASVYLAHRVALRCFPTRRQAWVSELPLLILMTGYTFIGLAVLSLPLALH